MSKFQKLQKLQKLLDDFQKVFSSSKHPTQPTLQRLEVLLHVYQQQPLAITEIANRFDLSMPGVSRIVHDMTELTSKKKEGIGVLELYKDPMNFRTTLVKLSKKGELFLDPIFKEFCGE